MLPPSTPEHNSSTGDRDTGKPCRFITSSVCRRDGLGLAHSGGCEGEEGREGEGKRGETGGGRGAGGRRMEETAPG